MKLTENYLLDSFHAKGTDLEDLKALLTDINERTVFKRIKSSKLALLSHVPANPESNPCEKLFFYMADPENLYTDSESGFLFSNGEGDLKTHMRSIPKEWIRKKGDFEGLINELENSTKMMIFSDDMINEFPGKTKSYFVSGNFPSTLGRFGLMGPAMTMPSLPRDAMIAEQLKRDLDCTVVIKTFGSSGKIFALLSGKYAVLEQKMLFDVIKSIADSGGMGKPVCREWEYTHFMTSVYIEFPEKAEELRLIYGLKDEFIPGLWIATSDTGDCSFKVRGTWRHKNSTTMHKEVKRRHIGDIKVSDLLEEVEKTIFATYTKLPQTLCELMLTDITDPTWDLSTMAGCEKNAKAIDDVVKNAFRQINVLKAVGKKTRDVLLPLCLEEFNPSFPYTAYDIAVYLMTLPERVSGINKAALEALQKVCGQAPYAKYDTEKSIAPAIFLTV